jgi:hypothetical protein
MMLLGTISAVIENAGLRLTIDGESSPTTKEYRFLASYKPQVGDRVLVAETGDSYVVLGKVVASAGSSQFLTGLATRNNGALYGMYEDGSLTNVGINTIQASSVWNRSHSDHTYPIVFTESNSVFYIAYSGGSWHKITTS